MFIVMTEIEIRGLINLIKTKGNWCNTVDRITYDLAIDCELCPMLKMNGECAFSSGGNHDYVYDSAIEKFLELRSKEELMELLL